MPLNSGCSVSALRRNISELVSKGYPQDQAVAVAMDNLQKSCKQAKKPMPDMGEIVPPEFDSELEELISVLLAEYNDKAKSRPTAVWGVFDYNSEGSKKDG